MPPLPVLSTIIPSAKNTISKQVIKLGAFRFIPLQKCGINKYFQYDSRQ